MPSNSALPAWIAGFFLGDGCFFVNKYTVGLSFQGTDFELLSALAADLQTLGVHYKISIAKQRGFGSKPVMQVWIHSKDAGNRLTSIMRPHLRGRKAAQADLALEYFSMACSTPRFNRTATSDKLLLEIKSLSDKGTARRKQDPANAELTAPTGECVETIHDQPQPAKT
jgi:LAGLIDADG-like domain